MSYSLSFALSLSLNGFWFGENHGCVLVRLDWVRSLLGFNFGLDKIRNSIPYSLCINRYGVISVIRLCLVIGD
ncbi:hypothetical protein AKJ16_DCAP20660 [Drosera capensis]